jgi:hypothetical protein
MISKDFEITDEDLLIVAEKESLNAVRLNEKMASLINDFSQSHLESAASNNRPPLRQPKTIPEMRIPMSHGGEVVVSVYEIFGGQSHYRAFIEGYGMQVTVPGESENNTFFMRTRAMGNSVIAIDSNGMQIDGNGVFYYESMLEIMQAYLRGGFNELQS